MRMNILITAAEAVPFAKVGGLADVVGTLPRFLKNLGHDVRVVMPRYYVVDREKYALRALPGVLVVQMGSIGEMYCGVLEGRLPGTDVPVYFLEHEGYYGREGIYGDECQGHPDNDNRFIFLSKASLELCKMINFTPDVVHAHDWHTAAVPLLMNSSYRHDPRLREAASVLTIHNMQHQGNFYEGVMDVLDVGWEYFTFHGLEMENRVNFLKGGINHATLLNTVSDGYAREMLTPEHGWGLEGAVSWRSGDLRGILNGVDYDEWNPESDPYLAATYSASDTEGKTHCKRELQRIFGLPVRDDVPLIGIVSRLVKQKGIDIIAEAIPRLMEMDIQLVILGTGESWAHFFFGDIAAQHPARFACRIGYDNRLAHQIEAGSDFFLMPSAFEPCGLNQMYSLRYGTILIVRATGGLDDSVENFDAYWSCGTGFKFWELSAGALFDTVCWAVHTWHNDTEAIRYLRQNAMGKRFTWEESAEKYVWLYLEAVKKRLGSEKFHDMVTARSTT